jgi:hypothetical protein
LEKRTDGVSPHSYNKGGTVFTPRIARQLEFFEEYAIFQDWEEEEMKNIIDIVFFFLEDLVLRVYVWGLESRARMIHARVAGDLRQLEEIGRVLEMRRGRKIGRKSSRKSFTKGARKVHRKNGLQDRPMRGGIRL